MHVQFIKQMSFANGNSMADKHPYSKTEEKDLFAGSW